MKLLGGKNVQARTLVKNGSSMSEYQFNGWRCAEFAGDALAFCTNSVSDIDLENCAPVVLNQNATMLTFNVTDDPDPIHSTNKDTNGSVFLTDALLLDGITFPAGSQIITEFVLKTTDRPASTLMIGRVVSKSNSQARLVFSSTELVAGQTLNFSSGGYTSKRGQGQNCFSRGTLIDTPHGALPVEQLQDGDEVMTREGGTQLISWVGSRRLSGLELVLNPHLQPVRIMAGALTGGRPGQDLVLSQDHRLLVDDWRAAYLFGEEEILVPAKSLLNDLNVVIDSPMAGVEYFHLLMNGHTMVCANGLWAETMLPGQENQQMLYPEQREQVRRLQSEFSAGNLDGARSIVPALPHQTAASIAA